MKDFVDKQVLITGGASGIGLALAKDFSGRGAKIIIADRNEEAIKKAGTELDAIGAKPLFIKVDLLHAEEVERLAKSALEQAGRVDILVNNAGIGVACPVWKLDVEDWDAVMSVNLRAPILLVHYLLPHMIERGSGHIVNVSSLAGKIGTPALATYTSSKFGLVGYSEAIRSELMSKGIGVTVVCPGIVKTPILETSVIKGLVDIPREPPYDYISPEKAASIIIRGIMKNKRLVVPSGLPMYLGYQSHKLFPGLIHYVARKTFEKWEREPVEEP